MNKVIISKTMPQFDESALFFEFDNSDLSDFIELTKDKGYWISFIDTEDLTAIIEG